MSNTDCKELLPHYVYILVDDSDEKSILYVGKGTGTRAVTHIGEIKKMINDGIQPVTDKEKKIYKLLNTDRPPIVLVIGRFSTKKEAFAVESVLIKYVYGFENLTNEIYGHHAEFIREKDCIDNIEGIDIPEPKRATDLKFKNAKIYGLKTFGAYEFLENLKKNLKSSSFKFKEFSNDKPFDPGEANGYLGLIVPICGIDFIISFTKKCIITLYVANTQSTRDNLRKLEKIETKKGREFKIGKPKNTKVNGEGRYRSFSENPRFSNDDIGSLLVLLEDFKRILSSD